MKQSKLPVCRFFLTNSCTRGEDCTFAHPEKKPIPAEEMVKNKILRVMRAHQQSIEEIRREIESVMKRRGAVVSMQELESVLSEQKVLRDQIIEAEKQMQIFEENIARLQQDGLVEAANREIRRFSPPQGKCLPFYAHQRELMSMIQSNQVCIVIGETGSGKSTQMIQYVMEDGLASKGQIVCCQPRKLAATSLATRVAEEWSGTQGQTGQVVGYKVGADRKETVGVTKMKFVTNRVLLNEILEDRILSRYSVVIVDEAHERSIDTDILLSMLKGALRARKDDLKLIITSATLDDKVMSSYFDKCPVIRIPGRTFPIEVHYQEQDEDFVGAAWRKALEVHKSSPKGHILVFLTGQEDIDLAIQKFTAAVKQDGKVRVLPLHGKLPPQSVEMVFQPVEDGVRKIIFATNQAETSITIDQVRYVIDSGVAKIGKYDANRGMQVLSVRQINRSSAEQRKGRAGRTAPGVCYRLYPKEDFEEMQESETAEILRSHLGICILRLKLMGIKDLDRFDFVERPPAAAMERAAEALRWLGCLSSDGTLTETGRQTARMEMEPMLCRMMFQGCRLGVGEPCVALAAIMGSGGGNVFYRGGTTEQKDDADRIKAANCAGGDFITALRMFRKWEAEAGPESGKTRDEQRNWCIAHFVNGKTMAGAHRAIDDLRRRLEFAGVAVTPDKGSETSAVKEGEEEWERRIRRAVAEGFFMNLAVSLGPQRAGHLALQLEQPCKIHPGSSVALLNENPRYVVFQELAETSRLFMRGITAVELEWIEAISPDFVASLPQDALRRPQAYTSVECHGLSVAVMSLLIGKRGTTITSLESRIGCIIEPLAEARAVRIWANQDRLDAARREIEVVLDGFRRQVEGEHAEFPVAGSTRVVIGSGALAQEVLFGNEFRKMFVSNVADWDWLVDFLRTPPLSGLEREYCVGGSAADEPPATGNPQKRSGSNSSGVGGGVYWGTVSFASKEEAQSARAKLDGYIYNGRAVSVRPCVAQATGVQICRDNSLRMTWSVGQSVGTGFLNFAGPDCAVKAAEVMNGKMIEGAVVNCQVIGETVKALVDLDVKYDQKKAGLMAGMKGTNLKRMSEQASVRCTMNKDTPGLISFQGEREAVERALSLAREIDPAAEGVIRTSTASGCGQKARELLPSVKVTGLPQEVDGETLVSAFRAGGAVGIVSAKIQRRKNSNEGEGEASLQYIAVMLRSMLMSAAEGLGELEDLQIIPPTGDRVKAFAEFSSPSCVAGAIKMFDGKPCADYELTGNGGTGKLHLQPNTTCTVLLPEGLGTALLGDKESPLQTAIAKIRSAQATSAIKIDVVDKGSKGWTLSIRGDDPEAITAARMVLDPLLRGEQYSFGDDGMAVTRLCNPRGLKEMERISQGIQGGYILWDRRINQILFFGAPKARETARTQLDEYVVRLANDSVWEYKVPPGGAVRVLVGEDGRNLDRVLKESECREVNLNFRTQTIRCVGEQSAVDRARQLIQETVESFAAASKSKAPAAAPHPSEASEESCPVCLCEIETGDPCFRLTSCGHLFHRQCISALLQNAAKPGAIGAVKCIVSQCDKNLVVRDLCQICSPDTLSQLCRRSFRKFCDDPVNKFLPCPTPDCPQVVQRIHPGPWQCDCCLRRYCVPCVVALDKAIQVHVGVSCESYRKGLEMAESEESVEVTFAHFMEEQLKRGECRKCPNCSVPQSKDQGCSHVTCSNCGRHWCFACAAFHAETGDEIYMHQPDCNRLPFS